MVPEADPAFDTLGSVNSRAMGYMCVCVYVFVFGFLIPWQYTGSTNHTHIAQIVETLVSAMLRWLSTCAYDSPRIDSITEVLPESLSERLEATSVGLPYSVPW
eukprot:gb/GECG01004185.1/.p1 GENE.gb/GECG01004185.1/~~gb/GECG01004185.1/.p1  ORF type:complete len:103 (+),score=6.87 gb/GECG01004185.1/:1-309(+)